MNLYRSIALSCREEKWDKVVQMLPKHGHLTRDIYLEAPQYDDHLLKRVVFENLRAIGDFCPNLERLDLNYPMRVDLSATEADLPPKIIVEEQTQETEQQAPETVVDIVPEETAQEDHEMGGAQEDDIHPEHNGNQDEDNISDDSDENEEPNPHDGGDDEINAPSPELVVDQEDLEFEAGQRAHLAARDAEKAMQRRCCAEIDYIIKSCPHLNTFSLQWTGESALHRFHHQIPKLKALRLWDRNINDKTLITTGTKCRDLERFYFDGEDVYEVSLNGLIGMLNALHTKRKSKLKRLGLFFARPFRSIRETQSGPEVDINGFNGGFGGDDEAEDENDDPGEEEQMEEVEEMGEVEEVEEVEEMEEMNGIAQAASPIVVPIPDAPRYDIQRSPLYKYLDVLSSKHPSLERLALIGCMITDDIIPMLGRIERLESLDLHSPVIQRPHFKGLSSVGITCLVQVFRGRRLSSLDLSGHLEISEDDMAILTGENGLKSLRYVRVVGCPKLADKYLCDEWVHPDDLVAEGGIWTARDGSGREALQIGDGWKEQWGE